MLRLAPWSPRRLALAISFVSASACTGNGFNNSSSGVPAGITLEDIGTRCTCETDIDPVGGGLVCKRNPTNSCVKTALTCVIGTPDSFSNAGNPLWEAPLFFRATVPDGGLPVFEGECTLVALPQQQLFCPAGSVPVLLSNGNTVCKRTCRQDVDCGRAGWVCDEPLLDRNGIDIANPPEERSWNLKLCRAACQADFPDCNRSTVCTVGKPGCQRSAYTRNAPATLGIYIGDRNGARVCNQTTGHCEGVASRALGFVGDACTSHADCQANFLCVSDTAYADVSDGFGFCTYADCNPLVAADQPGACIPGLTCEYAFEMGMCFPDCSGGTICGAAGQKCGIPDMGRIANFDPTTGQARQWKGAHCVDCDTTGICP